MPYILGILASYLGPQFRFSERKEKSKTGLSTRKNCDLYQIFKVTSTTASPSVTCEWINPVCSVGLLRFRSLDFIYLKLRFYIFEVEILCIWNLDFMYLKFMYLKFMYLNLAPVFSVLSRNEFHPKKHVTNNNSEYQANGYFWMLFHDSDVLSTNTVLGVKTLPR